MIAAGLVGLAIAVAVTVLRPQALPAGKHEAEVGRAEPVYSEAT